MMFQWLCVLVLIWNITSSQYVQYDDDEENLASSKEIPLDLLSRLNSITNMSELLGTIVEADDYDTELLYNNYPEVLSDDVNNHEGIREKRTGKVLQPQPSGCTPGPQVVMLKQSHSLRTVYFPPCILVPQCRGCCIQDLLTCRPVKVKPIDFQVLQMHYTGGEKLRISKKEIVTVEKHVKCECGCLILKSDCNSLQEYSAETCQCICNNKAAMKACNLGNHTKVWNPNSCECECRNDSECSTGFEFSHNTCRCEPKDGRYLRRKIDTFRYRFKKRASYRPKNVRRLRKNFKIRVVVK